MYVKSDFSRPNRNPVFDRVKKTAIPFATALAVLVSGGVLAQEPATAKSGAHRSEQVLPAKTGKQATTAATSGTPVLKNRLERQAERDSAEAAESSGVPCDSYAYSWTPQGEAVVAYMADLLGGRSIGALDSLRYDLLGPNASDPQNIPVVTVKVWVNSATGRIDSLSAKVECASAPLNRIDIVARTGLNTIVGRQVPAPEVAETHCIWTLPPFELSKPQ